MVFFPLSGTVQRGAGRVKVHRETTTTHTVLTLQMEKRLSLMLLRC